MRSVSGWSGRAGADPPSPRFPSPLPSAVVRPAHPGVLRPELELRDLRVLPDGAQRGEEGGGVDPVAHGVVDDVGHC